MSHSYSISFQSYIICICTTVSLGFLIHQNKLELFSLVVVNSTLILFIITLTHREYHEYRDATIVSVFGLSSIRVALSLGIYACRAYRIEDKPPEGQGPKQCIDLCHGKTTWVE